MKPIRSCLALLIAFVLLISSVMPVVAAETSGGGLEFDEMGKKTADQLGKPGEYEINLTVPGDFETSRYNEIIVMVDASLSQSGNFGNLKTMLITLAENVLSQDPSIRLTLMGFGVGPRRAGSFYSVAQLKSFLETATQSDLLQERSATNCEVGFEYVDRYIDNNSALKKTVVLYTSDGAANLDETPLDWSNWYDASIFDLFRSFTEEDVISYAVGTELEHIYAGNQPISATVEMFPDECAAIAIAQQSSGVGSEPHKEAIETLNTSMTSKGREYVTCILKHVFAAGGFAWRVGPSASDVEKAFQTYFRSYPGQSDGAYDSYMDLFYVILGDTGSNKLNNRYTRAAAASANLMTNEKVVSLYHVGYSGASNTWMNPEKGYFSDYDASKLKYIYYSDFAGVTENLKDMASEFVTTGYKDVTVTDPMSKWVTLDESSIRIVDNDTGTVLWQNGQWLTTVQLTAGSPISVTTNADGHREITWKIKDGWLLHTDRYSLRYVVNVDETAEGFEWGKEYPANDPTDVTYTDPAGNEHKVPIDVPDVKEDQRQPDLTDDDYGIRIYKQTKTDRKPISGIVFDVYQVDPEAGADAGISVNLTPTEEEVAFYAKEANKVATLTTDGYGYAFAKLEEGRYLIIERANEKVKEPVPPFYVVLPMYIQEDVINDETGEIEIIGTYKNIVEIYPKNEPVEEETPPPDPEIPEDPTPDKTGVFTVIKHDAYDESKLLSGAQFQLLRLAGDGEAGKEYTYGENGQTVRLVPVLDENGNPIIITTDVSGSATSPELPVGLYFLAEIQAPDGYYVMDYVVSAYATVNGTGTAIEPVKIPNHSGALLPTTGGIGTTMFYMIGGILALVSVVLLVTKRRMRNA